MIETYLFCIKGINLHNEKIFEIILLYQWFDKIGVRKRIVWFNETQTSGQLGIQIHSCVIEPNGNMNVWLSRVSCVWKNVNTKNHPCKPWYKSYINSPTRVTILFCILSRVFVFIVFYLDYMIYFKNMCIASRIFYNLLFCKCVYACVLLNIFFCSLNFNVM